MTKVYFVNVFYAFRRPVCGVPAMLSCLCQSVQMIIKMAAM